MPVELLVVDPDITSRHKLVLKLDQLGHRADCAFDGLDALRRVYNHEYRLIITELQMPEMDGYELAAAIRAYESQTRRPAAILALSRSVDRERCLHAGMNDTFIKPISENELSLLTAKYLPEGCLLTMSLPETPNAQAG